MNHMHLFPFISLGLPEAKRELEHAVRMLQCPAVTMLVESNVFTATVGSGTSPVMAALPDVMPPETEEGFAVVHGKNASLHIVSGTAHGLANGLYELRRRLLVAEDGGLEAQELLREGVHAPHFKQRDFYHFLSPWRLQHLSCDTFTPGEWKTHLDRMRALNANRFYFDIWFDQYFHPDWVETAHNRELYDRIKAACDYAHELGMRTGVYLFPAQVPVSVYLSHAEARGVEAKNYYGINACPSKGWEHIIKIDAFLLHYFGSSLDDLVVEMQDPGSCLCEDCCRDFPQIVLRYLDTYRDLSGAHSDRRIDVCSLHFRDWLEEGDAEGGPTIPIQGLRNEVFPKLAPGTTLIDIDEETLDQGRGLGLDANYFFFDLDPESGIENHQVFPRVKLRRIEQQVRESIKRGHQGITDYRMMPFAQFPADFVLFRKCWDPDLDMESILDELGAEYGLEAEDRPKFSQALRDLDAFWEASDFDALAAGYDALQSLRPSSRNVYFLDLCDLVAILNLLAGYLKENREQVAEPSFYPPADLVEETRLKMTGPRIFEAYTANQHWIARSDEVIGQRIRWWLQAIAAELGLSGCNTE